MLDEFSQKQRIPYPLLSDVHSEVIRRYGILNDRVQPGDAVLYGIPYPGVFVCDEAGIVISKFFHDSYKKRDSPELLLDAALGRVVLDDRAPRVQGGDDTVRVTAAVHGGKGTIRQGIIRQLLVRFELPEGLHVYGEPVPAGMIPVDVRIEGPPGLVVLAPIYPPTESLHLQNAGVTLPVWSGTVDILIPFYAVGELASEVRPLDQTSATLDITVRYQACDDRTCLLPRTETLRLEVPLDVIDIPAIPLHQGHGQREGNYDGMVHLKRLMRRKIRAHPLGFLRYMWKHFRLQRAARHRRALQPVIDEAMDPVVQPAEESQSSKHDRS